MTAAALPPVVDADTWQRQLGRTARPGEGRDPGARRHRRARRRLPMVELPDYTLEGSTARSGWSTSSRASRS